MFVCLRARQPEKPGASQSMRLENLGQGKWSHSPSWRAGNSWRVIGLQLRWEVEGVKGWVNSMALGVQRLLGTQSLRAHSGFLLFYLCSAWASHLQQCRPHLGWVFPVSWFTCQSPLELDTRHSSECISLMPLVSPCPVKLGIRTS